LRKKRGFIRVKRGERGEKGGLRENQAISGQDYGKDLALSRRERKLSKEGLRHYFYLAGFSIKVRD